MSYVPVRTAQSKNAVVDGKDTTFGTAVEVTSAGFGVKKSDGSFEVLDAMPLGRQSIQLAVELGSTDLAATTLDSEIAAPVDFATADFLTATEVDASTALDSELITSDQT